MCMGGGTNWLYSILIGLSFVLLNCHATSRMNDGHYSYKNRLVRGNGMGKNGEEGAAAAAAAAARKINLESGPDWSARRRRASRKRDRTK